MSETFSFGCFQMDVFMEFWGHLFIIHQILYWFWVSFLMSVHLDFVEVARVFVNFPFANLDNSSVAIDEFYGISWFDFQRDILAKVLRNMSAKNYLLVKALVASFEIFIVMYSHRPIAGAVCLVATAWIWVITSFVDLEFMEM